MSKYELVKPITVAGEERREIEFELDNLTGMDIINAQDDFEAMGNIISGPPELNKKFLAFVLARVAKIPADAVFNMSAKDFTGLTLQVQRFLLSAA